MARQHVEVSIVMKDRHTGANGDGANETIDQSANGLPFPTTETSQSGSIVIVHRPRRENGRPREQPAEVVQMLFVAPASQYFHPNRIADRDLAFKQCLYAIAGRRAGVTKKLDPRGRINQNHVERLFRNSLRSPSQPDPRRHLASSALRGSSARARSAKLIASRFVVR